MSAFTTDTLDDAILAGYCFRAVIDALNAGDDAEAGRQLRKVLALRAADDDGASVNTDAAREAFNAMFPGTTDALASLTARLAVVPVREVR